MPVTKTAKRALRASKRKGSVNKIIKTNLDTALRMAKRQKTKTSILKAISLADRAAQKKLIHKNNAARIKSALSKILAKPKKSSK
jgi:small subunit ribosomal protein S20